MRLPNRGYLLHITHYDPQWCREKENEKPFDFDLAVEVIRCLADAGGNVLLVDCGDGIVYDAHSELTRPYSRPKSVLESLSAAAQQSNIQLIPLLNFAQSEVWKNNHWFRPHNLQSFDNDAYWKAAFEVIDEILAAMSAPPRYFHIGMDEDHWRSHAQYVGAILRLHQGLAQRNLRCMIWNSSGLEAPQYEVFKEKSLLAEERLPKDIVHILYGRIRKEAIIRIRQRGFDVWGSRAGINADEVKNVHKMLVDAGGNGMILCN